MNDSVTTKNKFEGLRYDQNQNEDKQTHPALITLTEDKLDKGSSLEISSSPPNPTTKISSEDMKAMLEEHFDNLSKSFDHNCRQISDRFDNF